MAWKWLRGGNPSKAGSLRPAAVASGGEGTVLRGGQRHEVPVAGPPVWEAGAQVGESFQIQRLLGEGGMGRVYLARHSGWDLDVVLKVPKADVLADADHRHRVRTEAEAWTELGLHPHIAYCYYVYPLDRIPVLVIEYLDGGNLRDWIAAGHGVDLQAAMDLAIQLCHGLEHAHGRGLVHRDIKPENVLLASDGTLKITDFGTVRAGLEVVGAAAPMAIVTGAPTVGTLGTYEYMAPEQFTSAHEVDARTDIFAMGVCFYEMLCGRRPYELAVGPWQAAPDPVLLRGDTKIPPALSELLQRCVAWEPYTRPKTTVEVRTALCGIYSDWFGKPSDWAELPPISLEADGWNNRGVSYIELGKRDDALACFARSVELDPLNVSATFNYNLARWRASAVTDEYATQQLQELIQVSPDRWLPQYLLAQLHIERGDGQAAVRLLRALISQGPDNADIRAALAVATTIIDESRNSTEFQTPSITAPFCLSASGRHVYYAGRSGLHVYDVATGHVVRSFTNDVNAATADVTCLALASEGRYLLSGATDRSLRLWDTASGACIHRIDGLDAVPRIVSLSSDGTLALSADTDPMHPSGERSRDRGNGSVMLWDMRRGRRRHHLADSVVGCLVPDGSHLLLASPHGALRLCDASTARCTRSIDTGCTAASAVYVSADCRYALSAHDPNNQIILWDLQSGQRQQQFSGHRRPVCALYLSNDTRYVVSASGDGTVRFWEVQTGRCLRTEGTEAPFLPNSVAVDFQSRRILFRGVCGEDTPSDSFSIAIRDDKALYVGTHEERGDEKRRVFRSLCARLEVLAAGRRVPLRLARLEAPSRAALDASRFVSLVEQARAALNANNPAEAAQLVRDARDSETYRRHPIAIKEWGRLYRHLRRKSLTSAWLLRGLEGHSAGVCSVSISQMGDVAVSASKDGSVRVWDVEHAVCTQVVRVAEPGSSIVSRLSADGRYAVVSEQSRVHLLDCNTGSHTTVVQDNVVISSVDLSPDGRLVVTTGHLTKANKCAGFLKVWNVATGECLRHYQTGNFQDVHSVRILPDSGGAIAVRRTLWGEGADESEPLPQEFEILFLEFSTESGRTVFSCHPEISGIELSADGQRVVAACQSYREGSLQVCALPAGTPLKVVNFGDHGPSSMASSPDVAFAATAPQGDPHQRRPIYLWDLEREKCLATLQGHDAEITGLSMTSDCRLILSGSSDGTVRVWFLDWDLD